MSDPYEREAAKAAIHTLQRELAEVTKQRDRLAEAITHCVLRIKDYEKYLAGTRSNPPSSSAALEFAEKAIVATKGGAA